MAFLILKFDNFCNELLEKFVIERESRQYKIEYIRRYLV